MYQLLAWLPGENKFVAEEDNTGRVGFMINGKFEIVKHSKTLLAAATQKYSYVLLPEPVRTKGDADDIERVFKDLDSKHEY